MVKQLANKFGESSFKIKDYWDADLNAIGLTNNSEENLIYIAYYEENNSFFVSLENRPQNPKDIFDSAGEFDNLNLGETEKLFAKHLKLKTQGV